MAIQSQFSVKAGKVGGENVPGLQVKGTMPPALGRAVDMINHDSNSTGGTESCFNGNHSPITVCWTLGPMDPSGIDLERALIIRDNPLMDGSGIRAEHFTQTYHLIRPLISLKIHNRRTSVLKWSGKSHFPCFCRSECLLMGFVELWLQGKGWKNTSPVVFFCTWCKKLFERLYQVQCKSLNL